jgi:hypothetical protein
MERICRHARKTQEKWGASAPTPPADVPAHIAGDDARMTYAGWRRIVDIDDNDPANWECRWLGIAPIPPPLARRAYPLRAGDCDMCPCFAPVDISIPGIK